MAVTVVGRDYAAAKGVNSITTTGISGCQAGDVVVVMGYNHTHDEWTSTTDSQGSSGWLNFDSQLVGGSGSWINCRVLTLASTPAGSYTVTATKAGTTTAISCVVIVLRGADATSLRQTTNETGSSGTSPSATLTGVASGSAVVGAVVTDGPGSDITSWSADSDTVNGSWIGPTGTGSAGGGATSNTTSGLYDKMTTGAGDQTLNPVLGTSRAFIIMLLEVPAGSGNQTVNPTGIGSAGAVGSPTITAGPVTVSPSGVSSAEALGSPTVS